MGSTITNHNHRPPEERLLALPRPEAESNTPLDNSNAGEVNNETQERLHRKPETQSNSFDRFFDWLEQHEENSTWFQTSFNKAKDFFDNGPEWFQLFREHFTSVLNYIGIVLNAAAVVAPKLLPEGISKFIDEKSELFSKYIVPLSFAWNGVEDIVGKRFINSLTRFIPAVTFWSLPFYNFNIATGFSSGFNYVFEQVHDRLQGQTSHKSFSQNTKVILRTGYEFFKDMVTLNFTKEHWRKHLSILLMLGGATGGMLFAKNDRDSIPAKFFGNGRNAGGLIADVDLITGSNGDEDTKVTRRIVGASCITASILNFAMRHVEPATSRVLNHIAIAADDFGLTYWSQASKRANDKLAKTQNLI